MHYGLFLEGALFTLAFMLLGFVLSRTIQLTSLIDVLWPMGSTFLAYNLLLRLPFTWNNFLLLLALGIWCVRLSFFLLATRAIKKEEDLRYQELLKGKESHKETLAVLFQYLFQWFLQVCLGLSFLTFAWNESDNISWYTVGGFVLALLAICGESLADHQLLCFKKQRKVGLLKEGLWAYSRHPNYFFDWLFWLSIGVMGYEFPWGYSAFIGSLVMWIIFNFMSGPLTERLSLRKHKEIFEKYKKQVPFMIPLPWKKAK